MLVELCNRQDRQTERLKTVVTEIDVTVQTAVLWSWDQGLRLKFILLRSWSWSQELSGKVSFTAGFTVSIQTRKPSYRWQTLATRKPAKNCSNSTCLQRCRWQYWPIFMRLAAVASKICEIPRNSLKIQAYEVQGHPRSSILVPIESPYVTCY